MILSVVPIGNSKGIRIPKAILQQCNIQEKVLLQVEDGKIIIAPTSETPRQNWDDAFTEMHSNQDDQLLVPDSLDLQTVDWEW